MSRRLQPQPDIATFCHDIPRRPIRAILAMTVAIWLLPIGALPAHAQCLTCLGDLNGDGAHTVGDISGFVDCLLSIGPCQCADMNSDGFLNGGDIPGFVEVLLLGQSCTTEIDMSFLTSATVTIRMTNPPLGFITLQMSAVIPQNTTVRLSGPPYMTGTSIPTELRVMEFIGFHPMLGQVTMHENPAQASLGSINNVVASGGQFVSGDSSFGVFVTLDMSGPGVTAFNPNPVHVQATGITGLPPNVPHTSGPINVPLVFSNPSYQGFIVDVVHRGEKVCIYEVTCIDGPCNDCPVRLGDLCTGDRCVDTCATWPPQICGTNNCCVEYTLIACDYSAAPACQFGNPCPQPCDPQTGACCLPDGTCQVMTEAACKDAGGPSAYQGDGTTCTPLGACCLPGGSCIVTIPACCTRVGGTWFAKQTCDPKWECCLGDGSCVETTEQCCIYLGGTFHAGQTCNPKAACCKADGTCVLTTADCCTDLGGTFRAGVACGGTPDPCKGACCHGNGTCTVTTQAACNGANDTFKGLGTVCANFKPNITAQPQNTTVCENRNATFTITATGNGTLHYAWKKNGGAVGGDAPALTLNNVPIADDGAMITCDVKDDCGMVTSAPATLTVRATTANAAFVAANATIMGPVAASIPLGPGGYGLTYPESVEVTISADCSSGNWCAVMLTLTGKYSQQVRILPGQMEVTGPPPGNSTQANFCLQVTNLNNLGNPPPAVAWYMIAAVQAHENVHLTRFEPALENKAGVIETSIEALCVPFTGQNRAAAIAQIKLLPAYATALTNAQTTWLNEALVLVDGDHAAGGPTDTAEHAVVDPMVANICTAADNNCWGPCAVCPARTRGACCTGLACACNLPANCAGGGQVFKGVGTTCNPNPCP